MWNWCVCRWLLLLCGWYGKDWIWDLGIFLETFRFEFLHTPSWWLWDRQWRKVVPCLFRSFQASRRVFWFYFLLLFLWEWESELLESLRQRWSGFGRTFRLAVHTRLVLYVIRVSTHLTQEFGRNSILVLARCLGSDTVLCQLSYMSYSFEWMRRWVAWFIHMNEWVMWVSDVILLPFWALCLSVWSMEILFWARFHSTSE